MDRQPSPRNGDGGDGLPLRHPERDVMQSESGFDAESMLLSLGFSHVDPFHRIPQRFRSPSQVRGIDTSFLVVAGEQSPCRCSGELLRDPDESLGQRVNASFRRSVSSQTEDQEVSAAADLSERETLLTIIFKSLQLSLEYYCNLLFEFFSLQAAGENRSHEAQSLKPEHLSLKFLTAKISEEVSFLSHHLCLKPEHLLILSQDSMIHRIRNLSRIVRAECSRLLRLTHVMKHQSGESVSTSSPWQLSCIR